MAGYAQLPCAVKHPEAAEIVNLARHRKTTAKLLGQLAVRQLLVAAADGMLPETPSHNFGKADQPFSLWLRAEDRAALEELATRHHTDAAVLGSLAVRLMLAKARAGALPMAEALRAAPEPDTTPASATAAKLNLGKARLIVDRLHFISESGLNDEGRAALKELESLKTIPPF